MTHSMALNGTPTVGPAATVSDQRGQHRTPARLALALGVGLLATAPVLAAELASINFLPAVQSISQNARVQLVNLGAVTGRVNVPPGPCRVAIQFFDAKGDEVGPSQAVSIARGHSATVEAPVFVKTGLPMLLRAEVNVVSRSAVPPDPCVGLHGDYEIYDTQTLETKFVSPGAIRGFNPQPDPPGTVGR